MQWLIAIKDAIATIKEIISAVKAAIALYQQARREGWIQDGREIARKIQAAKTDEERKRLVMDLSRYLGRMP